MIGKPIVKIWDVTCLRCTNKWRSLHPWKDLGCQKCGAKSEEMVVKEATCPLGGKVTGSPARTVQVGDFVQLFGETEWCRVTGAMGVTEIVLADGRCVSEYSVEKTRQEG